MNRIEDRLRDAFGAAAGTVRSESVPALPDPSRVTRKRHLAALAAAAAVAVVIIGASVITPLALAAGHGAPSRPAGPVAPSPSASASHASAGPITVPLTIGMTTGQAMSELVAAGLNVAVQMQASPAAPAGTVVAQTPVGGTRVPYGATIMLTVAAGPGPTPTPAATR